MNHKVRWFLFLALIFRCCTSATAQIYTCTDQPIETNSTGVFQQNGVYYQSYKWQTGSVIKVRFLNGDPLLRERVMRFAKIWEQYANITFKTVTSEPSDIRISFNEGKGSYSYIGTLCTTIPSTEPTMNFGWFRADDSDMEVKRTTLHEFGHALGLLHEHQNPLSPIKWNLGKAYAYYLQSQNWSKEMVDRNVFTRYSVDQTNNEFDAKSIMMYHIPAELTSDGYATDKNYDLSEMDKRLIAELYPKPAVTTAKSVSSEFTNIEVSYNTTRNGKTGMLIKSSLKINNALNMDCSVVAYFYKNNDERIKSADPEFATVSGSLAGWNDFKPRYNSSNFTDIEIFVPYTAFKALGEGEFKLKWSLSVWQGDNQVSSSGSYYFSYQLGPICESIEALCKFDDPGEQLIIMPKFIIKHAQYLDCDAVVFFYYDDGTPLAAGVASPNRTTNGSLAFVKNFRPGYDITEYNHEYYSNLTIYVPYSELVLPNGRHDLKFKVVLRKRTGEDIQNGKSEFKMFTLTRS